MVMSRVTHRPQLIMPLKKLTEKLSVRGMMKGHKPTSLGRMIHFTEEQIVSYYNSIYHGLASYYSFADNRSLINRLNYILKYSCALTLASKLRLRTLKKVFKRFGPNLLIVRDGKISASFAKYVLKPREFKITTHDPFEVINKW
jgi:Type II intron maturase